MARDRDYRDGEIQEEVLPRQRRPFAPGKRTLTTSLAEVMRFASGPTPAVTPELRTALEGESGSALPGADRYSSEIGADVSRARVVTGPAASAAARSIDAQAFTVGERVFFGAGSYAPGTEAGDHILRHELTHVAQQAGAAMPPVDQLTFTSPGSAAEVEAHHVASSGGGGIASRPAQVARFDYEQLQEQQVGGNRYSFNNAKDLYFAFGTRLVDMPVPAPEFIQWSQGTAKFLEGFVHQMLSFGNGDFNDWTEIARRVVMPEDMRELINRGRVIYGTKTDDKTHETYDAGPRRFQDASALPLVHAIHRRILESLKRMAPRFLAAYAEAETGGSKPDPEAITASHPCDYVLIHTLVKRTDLVDVNLTAYRSQAAAPDVKPDLISGVDELTYEFVDGDRGPNWIRITAPKGATPELVASFVYGSPQESTRLVASPPLFGLPLEDASRLRRSKGLPAPDGWDLFHARLAPWEPENSQLLENERDPAFGLLRSGAADEAALGEAATGEKPNAGADRGALMRILERTRNALAACAQFVAPFGSGGRLEEPIAYIDGRLDFFETAPEEEIGRWFVQTEKQDDVVGRASLGLEAVERHLRTMGISDVSQLGKMPKAVRVPLERVATEFVDAAVLSRLVATAEQRVEKAELDLKLAPLETIEMILKDVQTRVYTLRQVDRKYHPNQTEWEYNDEDELWDDYLHNTPDDKLQANWEPPKPVPYANADAGSQALILQEQVLQLRGRMLAGATDVGPEIQELYKKVDKLALETEIAQGYTLLGKANDDVWHSNDSGWAIMANGVSGHLFDSGDMWVEGEGYKFWFERAWAHYQMGKPERAREDLAEVANDPDFKTYLQRAYDSIEDTQTRVMILKIATMIGIVLVTMGAGALAEGAAAGLGAGEIGAFIAGATVEAVSFTALDATIFGNDDVAGSLVTNFVGNLATFGLLRAWRLRKAAKVADEAIATAKLANATRMEKLTGYLYKAKEVTGETLIIAATMYAQTQIDAIRQRGEFASMSEIREQGKMGLAMVIGVSIGGRFFRHELEELKRLGHAFGEDMGKRIDAVRDLAKTVEVTKRPDLAVELVRQDRALLDTELELRQRADGGTTPKETTDGLNAQKKVMGEMELTLGLDEVVPGRVYMGTPEEIAPIVKRLEADGAKVKPVEENGRKRYEIEDGEKRYTINEASHYRTRSGGEVVPTTSKHQTFEANSVVGYVDSVAEGRTIMRRLAAGDRTALADIGYDTFPDNLPTNKVEWGLARRWDGALTVVLGGFADIDWAVLPHMKPLSHSHPFMKEMALKGPAGEGAIRIDDLADLSDDMRHLFPSAADVAVMARGGIKDHVVHTPFVARGDGTIVNPGAGETGPTVDFVIEKATYVGRWAAAEDVGVYKATVTARTPEGKIWHGEIYAVDAGASMLYKNARPEISPKRLGPPKPRFETQTGSTNATLVAKLRTAGVATNSAEVIRALDALDHQAQSWLEQLAALSPARVRGLDEWLHGVGGRSADQVADLSVEMRETLRLLDEHKDLVFDVGADRTAPMKRDASGHEHATEREKSFDVEGNKAGNVERSVEIKSLGTPVQTPTDLWGVLKKTGGKIRDRAVNKARGGRDIEGYRESRIDIHFYRGDLGKNAVRRGGDRYRQFDGDGNYRWLKKADDAPLTDAAGVEMKGNILDEVVEYLNDKPSLNDLDQLTLVDGSGVLAIYTNPGRGGKWQRDK